MNYSIFFVVFLCLFNNLFFNFSQESFYFASLCIGIKSERIASSAILLIALPQGPAPQGRGKSERIASSAILLIALPAGPRATRPRYTIRTTGLAGGLFKPYKGLLPALESKDSLKRFASRNIIYSLSPKGLYLFVTFYRLTRKRVYILLQRHLIIFNIFL